jgi:hypothetical protein
MDEKADITEAETDYVLQLRGSILEANPTTLFFQNKPIPKKPKPPKPTLTELPEEYGEW